MIGHPDTQAEHFKVWDASGDDLFVLQILLLGPFLEMPAMDRRCERQIYAYAAKQNKPFRLWKRTPANSVVRYWRFTGEITPNDCNPISIKPNLPYMSYM